MFLLLFYFYCTLFQFLCLFIPLASFKLILNYIEIYIFSHTLYKCKDDKFQIYQQTTKSISQTKLIHIAQLCVKASIPKIKYKKKMNIENISRVKSDTIYLLYLCNVMCVCVGIVKPISFYIFCINLFIRKFYFFKIT